MEVCRNFLYLRLRTSLSMIETIIGMGNNTMIFMPFIISVLRRTSTNCVELNSLSKYFIPTHGLFAIASIGLAPANILYLRKAICKPYSGQNL